MVTCETALDYLRKTSVQNYEIQSAAFKFGHNTIHSLSSVIDPSCAFLFKATCSFKRQELPDRQGEKKFEAL